MHAFITDSLVNSTNFLLYGYLNLFPPHGFEKSPLKTSLLHWVIFPNNEYL